MRFKDDTYYSYNTAKSNIIICEYSAGCSGSFRRKLLDEDFMFPWFSKIAAYLFFTQFINGLKQTEAANVVM